MKRKQIIDMIDQMLKARVKGQIQIDFSGDGEGVKMRFTNISLEDMKKLKIESEVWE